MAHSNTPQNLETRPISTANATWRVNKSGMENCCYVSLQSEMYRRKDAGEELMIENDTIKCSTCNAEMICDNGMANRLRWRWKGDK